MKQGRLKDVLELVRNPGWLCFCWFGLTAGISLLEAPVKFTAPLITRIVAVDVGRVVFAALNKVELVLLILVLILVRTSGLARDLWISIAGLVLIVIAQSAWLLPELAARSQQIVAGNEPAPSAVHAVYAVLELLKLGLLLYTGFRSLGHLRR